MQIKIKEKTMDVKILFSESDIQKRVQAIANQINNDYGSENTLVILIVLHGAILFGADLVRNLNMPTEIETIRIKSYEGTTSTGSISLLTPLPINLENKHVLIVEDIVDTGRSLDFLLQEISKLTPKSVKVCSLLNKAEAHVFDVKADYIGFEIKKNFVIGYGLDLDGKFRNLPYVADLVEI